MLEDKKKYLEGFLAYVVASRFPEHVIKKVQSDLEDIDVEIAFEQQAKKMSEKPKDKEQENFADFLLKMMQDVK